MQVILCYPLVCAARQQRCTCHSELPRLASYLLSPQNGIINAEEYFVGHGQEIVISFQPWISSA